MTLNMKMVMPSWSVLWVAGVGGTLFGGVFWRVRGMGGTEEPKCTALWESGAGQSAPGSFLPTLCVLG